jgi:hypothetical protein
MDVRITTYCTILYLLCSFLHVSTLNLGHSQGAASLFNINSVLGNKYLAKWQTKYISVSL